MLVSAFALAPAGAHGAPAQVSDDVVSRGPELSGDLVVYQPPSATNRVIRSIGVDKPLETLFVRPIPDAADDEFNTRSSFDWSVSDTRLAVRNYREDSAKGQPAGANLSLTAGPLAGPQQSVYGCSASGGVATGPFDVDGNRIAFTRGSCGDSRDIVVRNLATGANEAIVPQVPGQAYLDVVLAGRYVAFARRAANATPQDDATVVVYDLVLGANVTSAPSNGNFDLQSDGKLVTVATTPGPDSCRTSVAWYAPGDPSRRVLPFCPSARPRIAGNRVLLKTESAGGGQLVLSELSGASRQLLQSDAVDAIGDEYDLDPAGAAYDAATCSPRVGEIYIDDLAPAPPVQLNADCPLRVTSRRIRSSRNRSVTVRLRCPNGCGGELQLRSRRGNTRYTSYKGFAGRPGAVRVKLALRRSAKRTLGRTGRLRARVVANSSDLRSGSNFSVVQRVTLTGRRR